MDHCAESVVVLIIDPDGGIHALEAANEKAVVGADLERMAAQVSVDADRVLPEIALHAVQSEAGLEEGEPLGNLHPADADTSQQPAHCSTSG